MTENAKAPKDTVSIFIARREASGAAERGNHLLLLSEMCDLLGVPRPEPAGPDDAQNTYVFERSVTFHRGDGSTSSGSIDHYKRGCFVLEAKQGTEQARDDGSPLLPPGPKRLKRGAGIRGTSRLLKNADFPIAPMLRQAQHEG